MPTKLDETYEPRIWACGECHTALGVVMRDANRVRRLWVFTSHMQRENVPPTIFLRNPPRGMFSVHGVNSVPRPGGIECQYCGCLNDWEPSKEALEKMLSHYQDGSHG